ncbi:hypothetical protein HYV81_00670 [Candidatus Woesearchaeota archaeon]|nr:hypothetical protein [Candidatus Woesearchaeota archaeon]
MNAKKIATIGYLLLFGCIISTIAAATAQEFSIDRVKVNNVAVSTTGPNLIEDADTFLVTVDFTTVLALERGHVEAILKGKQSGNVVADSTATFDLAKDNSATVTLSLALIDSLRSETSFDLTIKIVDARNNFDQKTFTLQTKRTAAARDLDISIDSVEIEGGAVAENENNFISFDNGNDLDVRVRLTALERVEDAHIDAILMFENGDVIADATTTFDMAKDENSVKKLKLPIPRFDLGNLMLKVRIIDAEGDSEEKLYGLKVSQEKLPMIISSLSLNPENNIEAGKSLSAALNIKNSGVVPLEGMLAKVSIPELGVSAVRFIDSIEANGKPLTEEFLLRIPPEAPSGTYKIRLEISSQFNDEGIVKELPFSIGKKSALAMQELTEINAPIDGQVIGDGRTAAYPVEISNKGANAKSYTILVKNLDFGTYFVSPSNSILIKPWETKSVTLFVTADRKEYGQKHFTVLVKSRNMENEILLEAFVMKKSLFNAKNMFLGFLLLSAIIFAGAAAFFGMRFYMEKSGKSSERGEDQKESSAAETYYL